MTDHAAPAGDAGRPSLHHDLDESGVEPRPTGLRGGLAVVGAGGIGVVRQIADLYSVFVRTLYYCAYGRTEPGAIVVQMYEIGNKSVFFLTVVMGFLGMILVYQASIQALRIVPDLTMIGAAFLELLVRDLAASIGALMLATRVGAGIAAEIGSMVVTEQVDALKMSAADPIDYLIKPRFIASMIMTTVLIVWSGAVAYGAGMLTGWAMFGINPRTFVNPLLLDVGDVAVGFAKCIAYGAAIPIVSGQSGLATFGGSEGVGWATTRAVVNSSLTVIMLNIVISVAGFLIFPG
jgi:phospholipid/cholesterol/gamma-HCH transport system permease protein